MNISSFKEKNFLLPFKRFGFEDDELFVENILVSSWFAKNFLRLTSNHHVLSMYIPFSRNTKTAFENRTNTIFLHKKTALSEPIFFFFFHLNSQS